MNFDKFIQDGQDPKVVEKIYTKIADMLSSDETVSYIALQKKPAVTLLPDSVTISNKRIFLCEFTKLGLATNFEIFDWKEIKDIAFKEEIFGSKVTVIPFTGENLSIDYIPKTQARRLYQLIKDVLEEIKINSAKAQQEDREEVKTTKVQPIIPIRNVYGDPVEEEIPRKNQAVPVPQQNSPTLQQDNSNPGIIPSVERTAANLSTSSATDKTEEDDELTLKLKKLKSLYDKQLISQSEYENKKSEILSQL